MRNRTASRRSADDGPGERVARAESVARTSADRRSHERFVTVFRLAKLIGGREEFCLVRNLSAGGLKVQVFTPKTVGDRVAIDLGDGQPLAARVAWVAGENIGLSFTDQIDVACALSKAPPSGRSRARPIRLSLGIDALVKIGRLQETCRVLDISQGGAKLMMAATPEPGAHVTLEIEGLGALNSVVRWTRQGNVGVAFPGQLHYRQLAAWVAGLNL